MSLGPEWFEVQQRGFDSSGRPSRNTRYMWAIWDALREHPAIRPFAHKLVMVQSAFMAQGASASDGFHALGGCCDIRTWNLTDHEIDTVVWVARSEFALGIWRRDTSWRHGGMAEHAHWGQGGDRPQSSGSAVSWSSYVGGGDGLVGAGGDYERRPNPLRLTPPPEIFQEELTMDADVKAAFVKVHEHINTAREGLEGDIDALASAEQRGRIEERRRDREAALKAKEVASRVIRQVGGIRDGLAEVQQLLAAGDTDGATARLTALDKTIEGDLRADPDVDGAENPADR